MATIERTTDGQPSTVKVSTIRPASAALARGHGGAGGAGATTVAANLALAMAEAGQQVILVDGNLADPGASRLIGQSGLTVPAVGRATGGPGSVLVGPPMVGLLERLEAKADVVIIDAPPVLPFAAAAELAAISDASLLVARYGKSKADEVQQAWATLGQVGTTVLGVVFNAVPGRNPAAVIGVARAQGAHDATPAPQADVLERTSG